MPNPIEILKRLGSMATTPLVDEETIAPYQDALDSPTLGRSPMAARMRGFGAGAMEGMRGMTDPLSLASMAMPGLGALKGMGRAGQMAAKAAPTIDLVEPAAVRQVAPGMDDVNALIGDMQRNLARVPKRPKPMETLGERAPDFTPVGGEGMYNAGRQASQPVPSDAYQHLLRNMGGRGR